MGAGGARTCTVPLAGGEWTFHWAPKCPSLAKQLCSLSHNEDSRTIALPPRLSRITDSLYLPNPNSRSLTHRRVPMKCSFNPRAGLETTKNFHQPRLLAGGGFLQVYKLHLQTTLAYFGGHKSCLLPLNRQNLECCGLPGSPRFCFWRGKRNLPGPDGGRAQRERRGGAAGGRRPQPGLGGAGAQRVRTRRPRRAETGRGGVRVAPRGWDARSSLASAVAV